MTRENTMIGNTEGGITIRRKVMVMGMVTETNPNKMEKAEAGIKIDPTRTNL